MRSASFWPDLGSLNCEEGTVLQDEVWGLFGQVWFLLAVKREKFCRMCADICSLWPGLLSLGCEEWTVLQDVC